MDSQKFFQLENYIKNSYGEDDFIKKLGFILDQEEKKLEGNFSNISKKTNFSDNLNCDCENNLNCNNNNNNNCNIKDCDNFEFDDNKSLNKANKGKNNCYYLDNDKMQQIENLSLIFSIFKNLIFQADQSLIEFLLNDEHYLITFGAFEFDLETQKVIPHRKYFKEIVKFKNILNLNNQEILEKIHMNNRLSYLRDTAIGRFIEDNPLKIINSMIQTNNNSIIQFFLNETNYIKQLFSLIENKDIYIRKDACLFLIELINCTKDLMQIKINFFETLSEYGILNLIEKVIIEIPNETPYQKYIDAIENKNNNKNEILKNDKIIKKEEEDNINEIIKISLIEVLINILTSEPVIIKDYLMQNNSKLIIELCKLMLCNENFGFKYEISQIIKSLIENDFQGKKNSFDNLIFVEALIVLVKYLDIPLNSNFKKEIELNKQIIIEILCHLIYQYNKITQYWLDQNDVCNRIVKLIGYGSKILDLYSIKFIKCIIMNCDLFYVKNFLNEKLFSKIQLLFEQNKPNENLIFSSVCDLFDYSRNNSEQILIQFFILNREFFYDESNRKYFQKLIDKYEHKEEPIKKSDIFDNQIMNINLNNFDQKELNEKEDEIYFTDEKDFYLEKKRNSSENIDELLDNLYNNESKNEKNDSNKNKKYDEDIDFDEIS
jgi:protein phosphatase-4 regulatory subunit 3